MSGETGQEKSEEQAAKKTGGTNFQVPRTETQRIVHGVEGEQDTQPRQENAQAPAASSKVSKAAEWTHAGISAVLVVITSLILVVYKGQLDQMRISTDAAKRSSDAAIDAANSAKRNLDISQKNIDIAQRSIELTQKNVEIAQKNLEAAQQGLQYASKANEISETGMQAANNTPTLDVRIEEVTSKRTAPGPGNNDAIEISYIIENNSDAPAPRVFPECFLETVTGVVDASTPLPDSGIAIMPGQPISFHATLFAPTGDPKKIAGEINDGKVGIRVYVRFFSALGKETRFIQTFYKNGGRFASTDMKFNPPPSEILKLIDQSKIKPSQH